MNTITLHIGDVTDILPTLEAGAADLIVTSPPFLALRSYLPADHPMKDREIGSEPDPATFLDTLLWLTAEWGRILPAWGSLCVEIGDTYSGSGGAGGDYNADGLRAGQPKFRQADGDRGKPQTKGTGGPLNRGGGLVPLNAGPGWPLAKSLTGTPTLYTWSLAYGRNLLTGQPSPAGQWRIRNLIVWARPNPPVGALGDKFRPATSYITVASRSDKRWFDLDAVRDVSKPINPTPRAGWKEIANPDRGTNTMGTGDNPAGAPPLDWHTDHHPEDGDWLWKLPTAPYKGAHYATFGMALPERLVQAMCPREVCTVCGEGRRRIVDVCRQGPQDNQGRNGRKFADVAHISTTLGWSDCGCFAGFDQQPGAGTPISNYRPGIVLDPFGGSGTTAIAAALHGRDATLIDLDERNIELIRQRIAETLHIINETHTGDTITWAVEPALPNQTQQADGQLNLLGELT